MKKKLLTFIYCATAIQASVLIDNTNFSFAVSSSIFDSKSHETVYIPAGYRAAGRKISELTWEVKDVKLLGVALRYQSKDIGLYISYKKNISTSDGVMDDLDWVNNTNPNTLTHWSHHENTDVTNVSILDLLIKKIYVFESISLWKGIGYRQENQTYKAYDGYGNYNGTPLTFDGLGITFKQKYEGLYLSLGADYNYRDITFNLSAKYSPLIYAEYEDRHHFRNFTSTTNFNETSMLNLNFGFAYNIDIHQAVSLSYEYTDYDYVRGDRIRTYDNGTSYRWNDSIALDNVNSLINIAYVYKF